MCASFGIYALYTALFVLYYVLASWHLQIEWYKIIKYMAITSWNIVGVIGSADENYLKDVFGSFLCASYCAGVSKPQNPGIAGSNHTGSLTFLFIFSLPIFKNQLISC